MKINAIPQISSINRTGDALEPRRQSLIIIQTGVIESKHQAASDDRFLVRVLPESRVYKESSDFCGICASSWEQCTHHWC
jgi:hypothetical protein